MMAHVVYHMLVICRRDADFEHVTLGDSDTELESGELAKFEKVIHISYLHSTCGNVLPIYQQSVECCSQKPVLLS